MTIVRYDDPIHADGLVFTRLLVRSQTADREVLGWRHCIGGFQIPVAVWKQRLAEARAADAAREAGGGENDV